MIFLRRRIGFAHLAIITLIVILCSSFLIPTNSVHAAGIIVSNLNDSGAGSLRNAITLTNSSIGVDEITFSVNGTVKTTTRGGGLDVNRSKR